MGVSELLVSRPPPVLMFVLRQNCAFWRKLVVEVHGVLQVGENVAISPFTSRAQSQIAEALFAYDYITLTTDYSVELFHARITY